MIKTIDSYNFKNKKVLIRVDYNVPLDENLNISDDKRIKASYPTIKKILNDGGMPILISHLGRPKGQRVDSLSLRPVANYLAEHLDTKVNFAEDCNTDVAINAVQDSNFGEIVLLENLRYYAQEEKNDDDFSKRLSSLADVYVNDAFGTAHRAHSSTEGVTKYFDDKFAGRLIETELDFLEKSLENPNRPFTAIIGGAKISGKIDVINNLFDKCDYILIGGGMIFTFFKAMGYSVGKSLIEEEKIELAKDLIEKANKSKTKLILPSDIKVSDEFSNNGNTKVVLSNEIPEEMMGLDIGPMSIDKYSEIINDSKTIVWNGPMGVFEMSEFEAGTKEVANALSTATKNGSITIVGGGDSAAALKKFNLEHEVSHLSTGGGASLEFLEGKKLPGIEALKV